MGAEHIILVAVVALVCGLYLFLPFFLLYRSHKHNRFRRLVEGLPTSKVNGIFIGLVEVKGTAETSAPLTSYLAEKPCVWYSYTIEEEWRRTVTETYTDSKGNTQTRTRVESGWTTVDRGLQMQPFYLRDDTGDLLIRPEEADVEGAISLRVTCGRSNPLYYGKGPQRSIGNTTDTRRFIEKIIPQHADLYVIGTARERQDIVAPEIAASNHPCYLISTRNEEQIVKSRKWKAWLQAIGGLLILAGIPLGIDLYMIHEHHAGMTVGSIPPWAIATVIYIAIWVISWCWSIYNGLIDLRNRVAQGESQIDVQLQRRHDLIPQLADIVTAYARHESLTQERLASLRKEMESFAAGDTPITLLQESYPELKAQPLFSELSKQLTDTEDRIALAREYFNDIANHYNTRIQVYPDAILTFLFGLKLFVKR